MTASGAKIQALFRKGKGMGTIGIEDERADDGDIMIRSALRIEQIGDDGLIARIGEHKGHEEIAITIIASARIEFAIFLHIPAIDLAIDKKAQHLEPLKPIRAAPIRLIRH